ncbi:hypothetical protein MRX96_054954 [Rhipicephalus microplus]
MSGVHHVRHAANALVQATSSVVNGEAPHPLREAERVKHLLKPAGFSGQLPAVLQPASWRSLPAGYLPRDFIESPLTMVKIVDVMVVKKILLLTVGGHLIFKMLNFCKDSCTHVVNKFFQLCFPPRKGELEEKGKVQIVREHEARKISLLTGTTEQRAKGL